MWRPTLILAVLVLVLVGCQGRPTLEAVACPAALIEGVLVGQGEELLLGEERVVWPDGVRVWRVGESLALVGFFGQVIAREGDHISMGGGYHPDDDLFHGCGEIRVASQSARPAIFIG